MKTYFTIRIILFLMIGGLFACEPVLDEMFEIFVIPEGEHYCESRHPEALQSDVLQFRARFDSSAIYYFDDKGFQDSKNKLLGFSDCNSQHHENSARFAWQWYNNSLEIYAYCYVNGERVEQYLGTTTLDVADNYRIELTHDAYIFHFKDTHAVISRGSTCQAGVYMMLWPFFGGQIAAPHDVTIAIDRF